MPILLVHVMGDKCDNNPMTDNNDEDLLPLPPSKSSLKRDAHALQDFGEALLKLSKGQLARLPLDEDLAHALAEAQRMHQRGAHKRQLQFIGKLLRKLDVEPLQQAYAHLTNQYHEDVEQHHKLEKWRDRLLEEGDRALEDLLQHYPHTDRQHIRQLVRQAKKETAANKAPRSTRELFRYLRDSVIAGDNN